jgi:type VI secretion system protein ImpJ
MTTHLPLIPAIQWYEGMLLSPQHFQQLELRWQQLLAQHILQLSPYHWGILSLRFDPVTLPTGVLRILELRALMPDGLPIDFMAKPDGLQLTIDLTPYKDVFRHSRSSGTIYLCVPDYSLGSSPVVGEWPRFDSIEGEEVADYNVADNIVQIPRLIPKLSLQLSDVPPPRFVSFPIARVGLQEDTYALTPFMAPCFYITQLNPLGEKVGQLIRKFREKAAYLSEKWQTLIGTPLLGETSAQLRPLVQSLPILEPLILSNKAPPYQIYGALCQVAGLLSSLRLGQIPPLFQPYNHNDILGSTAPLIEWCNTILDSLERAYSVILFTHRDQAFSIMLQEEILTARLLIGIKGPAGMAETELEDWMKDAIIVSESILESVRVRRITGSPRSLITESELYDLMPGRGVLIFKVKTDNTFIKAGERLFVFNPADTEDKRPTEIILYLRHSEISGDVIDHLEDEE